MIKPTTSKEITMKIQKAILILIFGIFAVNSKADTGIIVSLHPLSSII